MIKINIQYRATWRNSLPRAGGGGGGQGGTKTVIMSWEGGGQQ